MHREIDSLENFRKAYDLGAEDLERHFENAKPSPEITPDDWQNFHGILFGHIHPSASELRKQGEEVIERDEQPIDAIYLENTLSVIADRQVDRITEGSEADRIAIIAETHCEFMKASPFRYGNGLVARAVFDLQMDAAFGERDWVDLDSESYEEALEAGEAGDHSKMEAVLNDVLLQTMRAELEVAQEEARSLKEAVDRLEGVEEMDARSFKEEIIAKTERERVEREAAEERRRQQLVELRRKQDMEI